ncbi:8388_t:CDS:1 [Funneliformis geosporum]|uniref:Small ribosomal subunit protein uS8m n=1 Tax=Funneliformis geosporum TaxID=1117311 RepID=A0A9W4X028_9GLOM|nr:15435_t:CDS:1 [Funneliformis geosporum]CAI2176511.1 8388_t:CDS:1 [Funneliformis geosporum]
MPPVHDICARVQNGFRARLQSIAIPDTKMNLAISMILYRQGFISSVQRGNHFEPDKEFVQTQPHNIASRRLWLDLKYRNNEPVLKAMSCVSKGSRRIFMNVEELKNLIAGRRAKFITPLKLGEVAIINTSCGVLEINEAIEQNHGGEILCRAI